MIKIGVFDSGMGGLSVANAIKSTVPDVEILFVNDAQHLPYGDKTPEQLLGFVAPILNEMIERNCDVIVVACNSVTTTIISELRERCSVPLIGMEPMVKPAAAQTKTDIIAVCATPLTLSSKRYEYLKNEYAQGIQVLEPDCSDWASMIETDQIDRQKITDQVTDICEAGADVIVLGCTHYHWIEELIKLSAAGRAVVLQPEIPVIAQLKRVLDTIATKPLA